MAGEATLEVGLSACEHRCLLGLVHLVEPGAGFALTPRRPSDQYSRADRCLPSSVGRPHRSVEINDRETPGERDGPNDPSDQVRCEMSRSAQTSRQSMTSSPSRTSTSTVSPSATLPSRMRFASRSPSSRWMMRFNGRAPKAGSNPSSASFAVAAGDTTSVMRRARERLAEPVDLDRHDLAQVVWRQRTEPHDVVDTVHELRPEHGERIALQIRGHDQHDVREVDRATLSVGETPVVHHLQQDVEHVGMRLLDLVEQARPSTGGAAPLR